MNIDITYPEIIKNVEITNIKLILGTRKAIVEVWKDGSADRKEIDLQPLIDDATPTQLTVIKGFLKLIVAISLGVDISEIPDTIFNNE